MLFDSISNRLRTAMIVSLLCSTVAISPAPAQTTSASTSTTLAASWTPGTGQILDVASPAFAVAQAGNVTFYGVAADCDAAQPAARVAVFDGIDESAPYIGDATFDRSLDLGAVCIGQSGMMPVGFTLIFDSRLLPDGPHTLSFLAEYPDGASATMVSDIALANVLPYESSDRSND